MKKIYGNKKSRAEFTKLLIEWGAVHGRTGLPWQNQNSYAVWVSEVMLQQTQVETVKSYFIRFMAKFPNVTSLALASEDEVLALWSGLGYYRRAKMLHQAAKKVVADFNGVMPTNADDLESLPGIGRSTSAAILSLGQEKAAAIMDGNVVRVLARYFAVNENTLSSSTQKKMWLTAENLLDDKNPRLYTQSIMDLGATICVPKKPLCFECPIKTSCLASKKNLQAQLPLKEKKKKERRIVEEVWNIVTDKKQVALIKNNNKSGVWQSMMIFPTFVHGEKYESISSWSFKHIFSHYDLHVKVNLKGLPSVEFAEMAEKEGWYLQGLEKKYDDIALPSPMVDVIKKIKTLI